MKNTGITYTSAERSPVILPEMAELLPPLSAEQLDALEADLIKNGCYSPIIVNEDMVIIDGHNRQALCEKHGLPYVYHPSAADYDSLRQAIGQYLSMFRERTPEWAQDGPKLVFICAPLRGDVEKNIEFARQKAQEVFADGDIPICPHLLFPPITDPKHPEQDKKVKEMSLRLLESCQQLNVYGPIWTDDMWKHIYRAGDLGIPVMTDQKAIGRTPPRRSGRKER